MTEELFHHGVKGMKWGVRKAHRGLPGTYKNTSKKNARKNSTSQARKGRKLAQKILSIYTTARKNYEEDSAHRSSQWFIDTNNRNFTSWHIQQGLNFMHQMNMNNYTHYMNNFHTMSMM